MAIWSCEIILAAIVSPILRLSRTCLVFNQLRQEQKRATLVEQSFGGSLLAFKCCSICLDLSSKSRMLLQGASNQERRVRGCPLSYNACEEFVLDNEVWTRSTTICPPTAVAEA